MRLQRPEERDIALELDIIGALLEAGRAGGFALWADQGRLRIRQGLQGQPDPLPWYLAAEMAIVWRLAQRAAGILATSPRKPAARQPASARCATQSKSR